MPSNAKGTVDVERWLSDDAQTHAMQLEKVWAVSHGTDNVDWFDHPVSGVISLPATTFFVKRDWTVLLPQP
jgi:hypothetical protein